MMKFYHSSTLTVGLAAFSLVSYCDETVVKTFLAWLIKHILILKQFASKYCFKCLPIFLEANISVHLTLR